MSYFVFDDVLPMDHGLMKVVDGPSKLNSWIPKQEIPLVLGPLVKNAEKVFDLSGAAGFELWTHNHTRPDWHFDKDEESYVAKKKLSFPICSMVYYVHIENVFGGELYFKDGTRILPKANRQIIFSPGLYHRVSAYQGSRISLLLNPWKEQPSGLATDETLLQQLQETI
jgi:hypothetical protein